MGISYASAPDLLVAWVSSLDDLVVPLAVRGVSTTLPDNYSTVLPFVRVTQVGGTRQYGIERARIRVECFANVYGDAQTLANDLCGRFETDLAGFTNGHAHAGTATINQSPKWAAWDDETVTRFMGAYNVVVQSH